MKRSPFIAFIKKEFYHIFRDTRTMLILLGIPVIQIILFGFAITTEVKNSQVAIVDPSKDVATQQLIQRLDASDYFTINTYLQNTSEIEQKFKEGDIGLVLVFSDRFNETLLHTGKAQIQIIADATDPNTATTLTNYAGAIINAYQQEIMGQRKMPYQITSEVKLMYNPQMKGAFNFVPGVLGMILILICAMMTSIAIVREKEMGTMEVLLVSPMKPILIIIAKAIPYFVLSCVNLTTVLLLSVYILDVPIAGSLFWLLVISFVFIFVSLSLGLLVSTLADTQMAAMLISGMAFMMPVMLLSGMIYPVENMPLPLQLLSNIVPAKWYIIAVKDLMIKGLGFTAILKEMSIIIFMGIVFIVISLKKFKTRLE